MQITGGIVVLVRFICPQVVLQQRDMVNNSGWWTGNNAHPTTLIRSRCTKLGREGVIQNRTGCQ